MGFLKRLIPIKSKMSINFLEVDLAQGRLKGQAHLECEEPIRVEEVRLEAKTYEKYTIRRRDSKGRHQTVQETATYFEKVVPISQSFEVSTGYRGDYPFEIVIPLYKSNHGGRISRMIKAVANVKGRPDVVSDEMFPFYDARVAQKKAL
jgi:hypothetical protein